MTLWVKLKFLFWFAVLVFSSMSAWSMTFRSEYWLKRGEASPKDQLKSMKRFGYWIFVVAVFLWFSSFWDLAHGTFRWRGKPETYGFDDFFRGPDKNAR